MGLLLICPHCQARLPLPSRSCPACRTDLRDLAPEDRSYIFGEPEEDGAGPALEMVEPLAATAAAEAAEDFWELPPDGDELAEGREVSLCEALDRILHKGAVLHGEVLLTVADIDLVYLGLQVILASVETARGFRPAPGMEKWGADLLERGI